MTYYIDILNQSYSAEIYKQFETIYMRVFDENNQNAPDGIEVQIEFPSTTTAPTAHIGGRNILQASTVGGYVGISPFANDFTGSYTGTAWILSEFPYNSDVCNMYNTAPTTPAEPSRLAVVYGNNQTVNPGGASATGIVVQVYDQYGDTWTGGISVTLTAPSSGASCTFPSTGTNVYTATSNASGQVGTDFVANSTPGTFYIAASASGCSGANITVTIKSTGEVCIAPTMPVLSWTDGAWANPQYWTATGGQEASHYVNGGASTPAANMSNFDISAALAGIHASSKVTSITYEHYISFGRAAATGPTRFNIYPYIQSRGQIGATKTNNKGSAGDSVYVKWTNVWTTFQNTGNPDNELFISQINLPEGAGLAMQANYPGGEWDAYGEIRIQRLKVIVCYVTPEGAMGSVPLLFCEG